MILRFILEAPIGLLPVLVYLVLLVRLDSYKLVSLSEVLESLAAGIVLAFVGYLVNGHAINALHYDVTTYSHFAAPVAEECLKAAFIIYMFARNRIGFMVDAAIIGFAVGAGFSMAENIYYLYVFPQAAVGVWVIRGLGTALMHGGATAIFGVMAQSLTERQSNVNPLLYLPGLAIAIALHALYNFLQATPLLATVAMLVVLPIAFLLVFTKSEHKIHTWLLSDYESHEHLLDAIRSGSFAQSEAGRFMSDIDRKFGSEITAAVLAYIRLHTELVLRAEKAALARETGEAPSGLNDVAKSFARLHALERTIGSTAMLAIWPHLHFSRRELWELNEFEHAAA